MISGPVVRRRRLEARLSVRTLAKQIGVSPGVIERLEAGRGGGRLQLATIARLAAALAVNVPELFEPPAVDEPRTLFDDATSQLASEIGRTLMGEARLVPVSALAAAAGRSRHDIEPALAVLEHRLTSVGARLHRLGSKVAIRPASASHTSDAVTAVVAAVDGNALTRRQATMLYRVIHKTLDMRTATPQDRAALAALAQLGLVELSDQPTLTATAHADLLIDELHTEDATEKRRAS